MSGRTIRVVAAVIEKGGRYLVTQRRSGAVLPEMWEFPGGRVEDSEGDTEALRREIRERLDADIEVGAMLSFVSHPYERYTLDLYLYECKLLTTKLKKKAVKDFRWISSQEFDEYQFTPADEASLNKLLGEA
jgi:8-oxo-dGTP diphosphatase